MEDSLHGKLRGERLHVQASPGRGGPCFFFFFEVGVGCALQPGGAARLLGSLDLYTLRLM
jgi:hypothetical protein